MLLLFLSFSQIFIYISKMFISFFIVHFNCPYLCLLGFEEVIKQHFKLRGKNISKQLSEWGREGKSSQNQIILTLKTNFELALRNL